MKKRKIGGRVFFISFFLVLAGIVIISLVSSLVFVKAMQVDMDYALETATDGFAQELYAAFENMRVYGRLFTDMERLITLIERNDLREMQNFMAPYLSISQLDTVIIVNTEGVVLCRPHAPDSIGENLSDNYFIAQSLEGRTVITMGSAPTVRLGFFYSVPVRKGAEIVGAAAFGVNLLKPDMLDKLSKMYRTELSFYYGGDLLCTTLKEDGVRLTGKAPDDVAESVLKKGRSHYGELTLESSGKLRTLHKPFFFKGDRVGMLSAGVSTAALDKAILRAVLNIAVAASLLLLGAMWLSYLFGLSIAKLSRENTKHLIQAQQAEAASQAKSVFLAQMSHEIRTPLNAIMGLSEVELLNDLAGDSRENLEKIRRSGAVLLSLINDVLDISKIESGKFEINNGKYDFPNMISDAIHINIVRLASKPIIFEPQIDENIPVGLYGDELRIKQILNNLLSNAFKYTDSGKVVFKIFCEPREGKEDEITLVCEICDTGRGIKKENLEKLFSEYKQFDAWANRKIEGTGLGLTICKKLVDMMGGEITAESEYGKGSKFTVRLAQGIADAAPIGAEAAMNLRAFRMLHSANDNTVVRVPIPGGKVLLVDDVMTNLDVAKGLLAPYGLTVHCASGGKRAVAIVKYEKTKYDAIFMDHMMPEIDGIEATRMIRAEIGTEYARTVPIIALTANALVGSEKMFLGKGFQAFLSKPINAVKLDEILNQWVRKGRTGPLPDSGGDNPDKDSSKEHNVDGIDWAAGVSRFGGRDMYLQTLRSYVTHIPGLLEKMRDVGAESLAGLAGYAVTVHGLKGASYGICAAEAGRMAENLEHAAKRGEIETVLSGSEPFIKTVESLISRLRAVLDSEEQSARPPKELKPFPDPALLEKFLGRCRRYDLTGMEEILSELEKYGYETRGELVAWLREQLEGLEYDSIMERLESALKNGAELKIETEGYVIQHHTFL